MPEQIEAHPAGYQWESRFPDAQIVARQEGGTLYEAQTEDGYWLITDEGTLADLLPPEERPDAVHLRRYDSEEEWLQRRAELLGRPFVATVEALLGTFADELATVVAERSAARQLRRINERDHLQPWSNDVLRALVKQAGDDVSVSPSKSISYLDYWPRIGNVDIALENDTMPPVFLELKCGASTDALGPCAWDVLKLALAQQQADACAGFLVAATTKEQWDKPAAGAEFFSSRKWTTEGIREEFTDWFRMWEKQNDPPILRLPVSGTIEPTATSHIAIDGVAWELRVARVTCDVGGWYDWEPLLETERKKPF